MVTKVCPDCNKPFTYEPNPNFADNRKYCDACGVVRKKAWEESKNVPKAPQNAPIAQFPIVSKHDIVVTRVEKPNSYEFGKAGNRHKIYYDDIKEVVAHIELLKNAGLMEEEFVPTA